jgi:lipid II:glycine glycyltransferase (peptidoglycan interpeptide bridge formation enzyme)
MTLRLETISAAEHLAFARSLPSASHTQLPSWGGVKPDWRAESVGWRDPARADRLVGAGLVLYRPLPRLKRYLAYLPEGPLIDWHDPDLGRWLHPLLAHLKSQGAFSVKLGPPVVARRWSAAAVKEAVSDPAARRLGDVPPTWQDPRAAELMARLRHLGFKPAADDADGGGFGAGQPRYVFQLPIGGKSLAELQQGFNQQWRRNIKKAEKAGVKVVRGGYDQLPAFYALYAETAERDDFIPRPLAYFQRMWRALADEDPDRMRLYLAAHDGDMLAAATMLTVGEHAWYSYGASTGRKREVQPNNAIQWQMMRDAHEGGATVYDFRGITDTLDESDPHIGLLRFKVGTGGEAAEYVGEWDFPLNKLLHKALGLYLSHR